ncbi:MAG: hypothetical protein JW715_15530 [Sedimentisphaerales bacterium]|nr:hypothetical protein [Sedimentisphaerales bacterium]
MKKQIDIKSLIIGILAAVCIMFVIGAGQNSRPIYYGRFQLVPVESDAYIIDTYTGQVWSREKHSYQSFNAWCEAKIRQD